MTIGSPAIHTGEPVTVSEPSFTWLPASLPVDEDTPFIQHIEMGNGEWTAVISATPRFYRAADGSQQPIDTRFEPGDEGFTNLRNLVEIGADPRRVSMQVGLGLLTVGWQPEALLAATGDREVMLAQPQATLPAESVSIAEDGQIIRYLGSWSLPGLTDEILALPGAAEHTVIFAQPPLMGDAESLRLRARLQLPAGAQLWTKGALQVGAFETESDVEIRPVNGGEPLILTPAYIFEEKTPSVGITARYRFEPTVNGWRVTMSTPADWWRDPTRAYPIVWDPKIQVLRPLEFAQRVSAGCGKWDGYLDVGRTEYRDGPWTISCQYRGLLRFSNLNQLTLPPGAAIEKATLVVVPDDGFVNVRYNSFKEITLDAEVRPVTSSWAHNAAVGWDNNPSVGAPIGPAQRYWRFASSVNGPFSRYFNGMRFTIQTGASGLVTNWINGGVNHGLELRAIPSQESSCVGGCNYATIPIGMAWSPHDKSFNLDYDSPLGGLYDTPGVALVIQYRGPTLPEGKAVSLDGNAPVPPTPGSSTFNRTFHAYNLQPSNGAKWTAVGVKGLRRSVFDANGLQMSGWFSHVQWSASIPNMAAADVNAPASGTQGFELPLSIAACDTCSDDRRSQSPGEPRQGSNFVLMAGGFADGKQARIHAPKADPRLDHYAVEVVRAVPLTPPVDMGQVESEGFYQEYNFSISTDHLLALRTINLPANSNVLLRMQTEYSEYNTAPVEARLF
ncbi:MAG: hypothetical protein KF893_23255, partial [Caldilineaceae bacterium]|nr:hypothetical protein [Caldilineaceae bacterium]